MTRGPVGGAGCGLQLHGGVAEEDPRAANIRISNTKLGAEGLTGGEKFTIGMKIANAGLSMGMGGVGAISAIQDVMTVVQTVRMLQRTMSSLKISYAAWETSVEEEQDVLLGNPFKPIPTEPVRLAYIHELK